jgi:hypothetical protein
MLGNVWSVFEALGDVKMSVCRRSRQRAVAPQSRADIFPQSLSLYFQESTITCIYHVSNAPTKILIVLKFGKGVLHHGLLRAEMYSFNLT